jgi:hypothetical protein
MTSIHQPPKTEEDRLAILERVRRQAFERGSDGQALITCGDCARGFPMWAMYRCFYCGVYFCRVCAGIHFGPSKEDV